MSNKEETRSTPVEPGTGVVFHLPFGLLLVSVPGAQAAYPVEPVGDEHVVLELRTSRGELVCVAAYRDLQALLGREPPVVWAAGSDGVPVRVTEHAAVPDAGPWWDGVLEQVVARTRAGEAVE